MIKPKSSNQSKVRSDEEIKDDEDAEPKKREQFRKVKFKDENKVTIPSNRLCTTCTFALIDKDGNQEEYLGFLDTGSLDSLITQDLVDKYKMRLVSNNGV